MDSGAAPASDATSTTVAPATSLTTPPGQQCAEGVYDYAAPRPTPVPTPEEALARFQQDHDAQSNVPDTGWVRHDTAQEIGFINIDHPGWYLGYHDGVINHFRTCGPPQDPTGTTSSIPQPDGSTSTTTATPDGSELHDRSFVAIAATDGETSHPFPPESRVFVGFEARDDDVVGRWSGGCNSVGGPVDLSGGRIRIVGTMVVTAVGCTPDAQAEDEWMSALLTSTPSWQLHDDVLVIANDAARLELRAE